MSALKTLDGLTINSDSTTEVDPCEDLLPQDLASWRTDHENPEPRQFRLARLRTLPRRPLLRPWLSTGFAAHADDRDILRDSSTKPYVFVILDTSGSMNWAPKCTRPRSTAGTCTYLCPTGDCAVPRDGDDPASKFRQSKEALYEVLQRRRRHRLRLRHLQPRRARSDQQALALPGPRRRAPDHSRVRGAFPAHGSDEVFGATIACDRGDGDDNEMGCFATCDRAADTNDVWEMTKVRRLPKFGVNPTTTAAVSFYIRDGGQVYYVTYTRRGPGLRQRDPGARARGPLHRYAGE